MDKKSVWKAIGIIKDPIIRAYLENAVQEQAERGKGCEYCNGKSLKNLIFFHQFGEPKVGLHGGNTPIPESEKPIFCPKCGRRLK